MCHPGGTRRRATLFAVLPLNIHPMNLLPKVVLLLVLIIFAGFVLLHVLPWLLGMLVLLGAFKLHQALKDRRPPPPSRWP